MTGIGCLKRDLHKNEILYAQFEERFKKLFSINENDELKSKIVKKEQYKYGIKSFNKKSLELYKDFWKLMNKSDYIYYICVVSKLEYILTQFNYNIWRVRDYSSFVYSIVKAVNVYRPKEVLKALFEENDLLLEELVKFLRRKISENENNPIKVHEIISFKECITILEEINGKNINLKWKYNNIFIGFKKLVNELGLNDVKVVIDKEGNPNNNTANACKKEGFKNVIETDSKKNVSLRCTDLMCGFISKMMRAIYEDTKTNQIITTYDTKIAAISIDENKININGSNKSTYASVIEKDDTIYIPIKELENVYGIEMEYIENSKVLTIDSVSKEQKKAIVAKNVSVKSSKKFIAKTIDKVKKGDYVIVISESDGYARIRTSNGKLGYIKSNKIANVVIVRENIEEQKQIEGKVNLVWDYYSTSASAPNRTDEKMDGINVVSPAFFYLDSNGNLKENIGTSGKEYIEWAHNNGYKVWPMVQNAGDGMLKVTSEIMNDYNLRKQLIENIIKEKYSNYENKESLRNTFINTINEKIDTIQSNNIGNEEVKITVYENEGKTVRTSIEKTDSKITIDLYNGSGMKIDKVTMDENVNEKFLKVEKDSDETQKELLIEYEEIQDNEIINNIQIDNKESLKDSQIIKNIKLGISNEKYESILKIENNIEIKEQFENQITLEEDNIKLQDLNEEQANTIKNILNENIQEQLTNLNNVVGLENYIKMLQNLKIMKQNSVEIPNSEEVTDIERKRFNSQFEFFESENLTADNIKELMQIVKNNFNDMKVILKTGEVEDLDLELLNSNGEESNNYKKNISEIVISIKQNSQNEDKLNDITEYLEIDKNNKYTVSLQYNDNGLVGLIRIKVQED